ncbi:cytochrome c [Dyella sp. A6]|uniref:c-type cytochrome n=1 Tax=Dyella aluminiiresistens TaxID=3069105 RepID=UPI002E7780A3|nr:cytochrome c [Dyella sp. A6]
MPMRWTACLIALCLALPVHAADLKIDLGHGSTVYSTAQLLARPDARTVAIPHDVAYGRAMRYRAIPLRDLLPGIAPGDHLQFVAADGFIAEIPAAVLLNRQGAHPWLAVEDPAHAWPDMPHEDQSPAPLYLVWTHPEAAHISSEQWPYRLVEIRLTRSVDRRFPAIVPSPTLPAGSPVRRGFAVFKRTCFACHTLNGEGHATLGPDLNIPYNPTEYLHPDLLRAFIRNPQSLHRWPTAKMHGFPTQDDMSDADLNAVIAYLRYMAKHKVKH